MKGDVGMSVHEKEGKKKENKKMPRPRQEIIDNPIPTSLFMRYAAVLLFVGTGDAILRRLVNVYTIKKQKCRDTVINDFLSWSRHLLVPLLFHELTSLHPPSFQRNDISNVDRQMTSSMHFGGWLVSFADKATIVWYVKANSTSTYIE